MGLMPRDRMRMIAAARSPNAAPEAPTVGLLNDSSSAPSDPPSSDTM